MKVVILAGGRGTRLAEETLVRPKPMVEIGGKPILWHILKLYAAHGFDDFVIACGYKGYMIKEYFLNYFFHQSDLLIDLKDGSRRVINGRGDGWRVRVVDTGQDTMTGGRILRLASLLADGPFLATYGDGVGDIDIRALVAFHRDHGRLATVTAVHPPPRFGALRLDGPRVQSFTEKPLAEDGWINGGFFVFEPGVLDYLEDDRTILEREPMERLAADGQLMAYRHRGFWQPMDTLRDKDLLEARWEAGDAPWRVWT